MDQHADLAGVIHESFKVIIKETLFENTFPSVESCTKLTWCCLYMASETKRAIAIKE